MFSDEAWSLLAVGKPSWFNPILRLGTEAGLDITEGAGDPEELMNAIEPALLKIHAYWKGHRAGQSAGRGDDGYTGAQRESKPGVRGGPKIGRNDPSPCASGKKFKKCCGANGVPPTVPTLH
jgi:uncharacterized protein YecA (UPF0149 family)